MDHWVDPPEGKDPVEQGSTAREHGEKADADTVDLVKEAAIVKNGDRNMADNADENLNLIGYVSNNSDLEEVVRTGSSDGDLDEIVTSDSDVDDAIIGDAGIDEPVMDDADINNGDIDGVVSSDGDGCTDGDIDEAICDISDSETDDVTGDADMIDEADMDEAVTLSTVAIDDEVVDTSVSDADIQRMVISLTQDASSRKTKHQDEMTDNTSHWSLLDQSGRHTNMPLTTLVVGSHEDSDIMIEVDNVDKHHAELTYDSAKEQFSMQDLGSMSGTFVNERRRIPEAEQDCLILEQQSSIRFGDDSMSYLIENSSSMDKLGQSVEMPNWAKRDFDADMAECPGCIAEQGIHHTCGVSHLECLAHKMVISPDQPQSAPVRHITDSPITCTRHNGAHHTHQHHAPPHHYHAKPAAPSPVPKNSSSPQWSTHSTHGKVISSATKPSKTPPPSPKQSPHVEYVYSSPVDGAGKDPQHRHGYVSTPVDVAGQPGIVEVPYQQYRLLHHPVQYQHMPPGAPLVHQSSQQAFMSCAHGSYGDVLYATEHYRRMCAQSESSDKQYQQFHLVKHMYNVPMTHHGNVVYASNESPTFINSGMIPDFRSDPSHCVEGAPRASPPVCESPNVTRHSDVSKTKSKSMSAADYGNTSSRRGSSGSNRTSSSNRSTPESPIMHRVGKRLSLAGTDSELETVKKCTPLYGQPSWWGGWNDDGKDEKPSQDKGKVKGKCTAGSATCNSERPNSLALYPAAGTPPPTSTCSPGLGGVPVAPPGACWYTVEIIKPVVELSAPHQPLTNEGYVSESERLLEDFKQRSLKAALWTPPERDPGPGEKTQQPPVKPTPNPKTPRVNMSGTAFTIDLRDGDSSPEMPKINMSDSLSKFLPHKVRRSFKERSDKFEKISARKVIAATIAAKQKNARWLRRKSTTAVSPTVRKKQFGSPSFLRRSGYLSDGHHSAFSSDNEDLSIASELIPRRRRNCQSEMSQVRRNGTVDHQNSARQKASSKKTGASRIQSNQSMDRSVVLPLVDKMKTRQSTDRSKLSHSAEKSKLSKSADKSKMSQSADKSKMSKSVERSKSSQSAEKSKVSQSADRSKSADMSKVSQSAGGGKMSQSADKCKVSQSADRSKMNHSAGRSKGNQSADKNKEGPSSYLEARQLRHSQHSGKPHDAAENGTQSKSPVPTSSQKNEKGVKSTTRSESQTSTGCHPPDSPDDASEAGTYTIDDEVEVDKSAVTKARLDIDRLFGLEQTEASDQGNGCLASDVKHSLAENEVDIGKMSLEELMKQDKTGCFDSPCKGRRVKGVMKQLGINGVLKQKAPSRPASSEREVVDGHRCTSSAGGGNDLHPWGISPSNTTANGDSARAECCPVDDVESGQSTNRGGRQRSVNTNIQVSSDEVNGVDEESYLFDADSPTVDESGRRRATVCCDGTRGERFTISFDAPPRPPTRYVSDDSSRVELNTGTVNEAARRDSDASVPVSFIVPVGQQGTSESDYDNEATNRVNAEVLYELMAAGKNRRWTAPNLRPKSSHDAVDNKAKRKKAPWKQRQPPGGLHRNHASADEHSESETSCVGSDLSTDCSLASPHGRVKMLMSSMRTNRTFALRRARLNSSESESSPKVKTSVQREKRPKSRPTSAADPSTRRKSGVSSTPTKDEKLVRKDGGRFSMRLSKTTPSEHPAPSRSSEPRDGNRLSKPSSNLLRSLSTGSGSKSQPTSRSNSPHSQEYNCWKRRKEYDPRRAVTEAKLRDSEAKLRDRKAKQASKLDTSTNDEKSDHAHARHHEKRNVSSSTSTTLSRVLSSTTVIPLKKTGSSKTFVRAQQRVKHHGDEDTDEEEMEQRIMQLSSEISHDILALTRADEIEEFAIDFSHKSMTVSSNDARATRSAFSVPKAKCSYSPSQPPGPSDNSVPGCSVDETKSQGSHVAVIPSIYHMSCKLKLQTDRILQKSNIRHTNAGSVSPPATTEDLTTEQTTAEGQLILTMHNLRHIESHLTAIEESNASGGASASGDNVASHRNDLQRLRREVIRFRPIEKASGKTVITKSCGITDV